MARPFISYTLSLDSRFDYDRRGQVWTYYNLYPDGTVVEKEVFKSGNYPQNAGLLFADELDDWREPGADFDSKTLFLVKDSRITKLRRVWSYDSGSYSWQDFPLREIDHETVTRLRAVAVSIQVY
jgi:hypothetical protein